MVLISKVWKREESRGCVEVNELHCKMCFKKERLSPPSLKGKSFIREGFDDIMEDITAEDITLRSGGVGFLQVEATEVREECVRKFHFTSIRFFFFLGSDCCRG